jgi:4-hydroxymandelate oxidase
MEPVLRATLEDKENNLPVNLADFEPLAQAIISKPAFDHLSGGADDERTLRENLVAFQRIQLLPRVLKDVTRCDLSTSVLGQRLTMPVILAPVACHRLFHPEGEFAVARAAAAAGIVMTVSTGASYSLEEVAASSPGSRWFQLYAYQDRGITRGLVERAEAAGYQAICLTVDSPVSGRRERDLRSGFIRPKAFLYKTLVDVGFKDLSPELDEEQLLAFAGKSLTVALTWDYLDWLRSLTRLPFLLKGILCQQDALTAASKGIEGIIVSNHGGRQLDGTPASIDVLQGIAEAIDGRSEVLVDSGVRRGTDMLKALALGAKAVLIGRPYIWGLAVDGEAGVKRVLDLLREEFLIAMSLAGCVTVDEINRELIFRP